MRIEILCTGDEVLSGKTINTNYSHMARRLQENFGVGLSGAAGLPSKVRAKELRLRPLCTARQWC